MKCLIVEDDPVSSQVLEKMISMYGTFDVADNGQVAVDLFRQGHDNQYDLILMDILMPVVNGLQSVQTIRELEASMDIPLTQRVKIIMTTALDDPRTVMKALYESDANSYLIKPIRLEKFENELRMLQLIS